MRAAIAGAMGHLRPTLNEVLFGFAGLLFSVGVVALNWALEEFGGLDLLSVFHWFILPTGPLAGGAAVAGGYYFIAKLTHTLPSKRMLFEMLALGASTWVLYRYVGYYTMWFEGVRIADRVDFFTYLSIVLPNLEYSTPGGSGGATHTLGNWAYAREAVSVAGMSGGAFLVYGALLDIPVCDECKKFREVSPITGDLTLEQCDKLTEENQWQFGELPERCGAFAEANASNASAIRAVSAERLACPSCFHTIVRWNLQWLDRQDQHKSTPIYEATVDNELLRQLRTDADAIKLKYPAPDEDAAEKAKAKKARSFRLSS